MPYRRFVLLVTIAAVLAAACGGTPDPEPGTGDVPNPVTGVVTDVDSTGIGEVRAFTLTSRGRSYEFHIADDVDYGEFDLGHLQEHRTSAEPVIVEHETREGRLYAISIDDA